MIPTEKQMLRLRVAEALRAIDPAERAEKSAAIAAHLASRLGSEPGLVLGFAPMRREPDWTAAIGAGWQAALPRVEGERLIFHRVDWKKATDASARRPCPGGDGWPLLSDSFSNLERGVHGTREPAADEVTRVSPTDAAAVLVPGVAFDRAGARLGRGGGFYDRLLAHPHFTARRIAVCFACQLVARVPVEPHDIEVDEIVTEDGWLVARSNGRGRD
jgi:5-formyltetrahydrofolate cyclo-ligase